VIAVVAEQLGALVHARWSLPAERGAAARERRAGGVSLSVVAPASRPAQRYASTGRSVARRSGTRAPTQCFFSKSASTGRTAACAAREERGRSRGRATCISSRVRCSRGAPLGADGAGVLLSRAARRVHRA